MKTFRITHQSGLLEEVEADGYREYKQRVIFQGAGTPVRVYEKRALLMIDHDPARSLQTATRFSAPQLLAQPSSTRV